MIVAKDFVGSPITKRIEFTTSAQDRPLVTQFAANDPVMLAKAVEYVARYEDEAMLQCIELHCIVLYCIVLYCIVLYCIVLYCIVLYCIVLYCIALYCIVLYCIVLHCIVLTCSHCDGVDINCGCPQNWVMSDGYGASLLENPQIVKGILNYNAISVC
jgi:hypothetical protein